MILQHRGVILLYRKQPHNELNVENLFFGAPYILMGNSDVKDRSRERTGRQGRNERNLGDFRYRNEPDLEAEAWRKF